MKQSPSVIVRRRWFLAALAVTASSAVAQSGGRSGDHAADHPADHPVVRVEVNGRTYAGQLKPVAEPASTRPVPPSTPSTPAPPSTPPTPDVVVALEAGPAPLGVHLDAADAIDPTKLRETRVTWDFGDPAGAFDVIDGYNAAHVYDAPGTYAITRTVVTPAGTATRRYRVEVRPDARRTVYASADGDDRNDGRSPARPVRSFARATAAIGGGDARVLFRRGDRFEIDRAIPIARDDVLLGAYGDAAAPRPLLVTTRPIESLVILNVTGRRTVIEGLAFDAPEAKPFEKAGTLDIVGGRALGLVIRDCAFLNVSYAMNGNGKPSGVLMQGNDVPLASGLRSYFAWIQGENWTILGNRAANSTREHIVRVGGGERVNVQFNDFANLDRRQATRDPDAGDTAKAALNVQKGAVLYVAHNVLKGANGVGPLGKADGMTDKPARWVGAVVEHNRIDGFFEVKHGASHVTYRHNHVRSDDHVAFAVDGFDAAYGRGVVDFALERNTVVNAGKLGNFVHVAPGATGLSLVGNLYAAPELVPGAYAAAAVYVEGRDLGAFAAIAGNVWPVAKPNGFAHNSVQYVAPTWGERSGYLEAPAWAALPPVSGDRFEDVSVAHADDGTAAARLGAGADAARLPTPGPATTRPATIRPAARRSATAREAR